MQSTPSLIGQQDTDDEFDEDDIQSFIAPENKVDESFGSSPDEKFKQQQDEFMKLAEKYNALQANFNSLEDELQRTKQSTHRTHALKANTPAFNSTMQAPQSVITVESLLRKNYISQQPCVHSAKPAETSIGIKPSSSQNDSINHLLNDPNISLSEKVLLENTSAQRMVSQAMTLDIRRKALPKLTKYKGDAKNWIRFKKEVQRYKSSGCYDDEVIKLFILGALEDVALRRVEDMIDISTLNEVMSILESSFGHSPSIIKSCEDEIFKIKINGELMRNDVVQINALIQTYFTACKYAEVPKLNSNILAMHILNQLNSVHKLFFRKHFQQERPNAVTQIADLDVLFTFLEEISRDLEVRTDENESAKLFKPAQINAIVTSSHSNLNRESQDSSKSNNNYKFEILDKATAHYVGYDLTLVSSLDKLCHCCGQDGHFTLECSIFKQMSHNQRVEFIASKNVCRSCLLTANHNHTQCSLKLGCGFKNGQYRCAQKHHILLHESSNVNNNYRGKDSRPTTQSTVDCTTTEVQSNQAPSSSSQSISNAVQPATNVNYNSANANFNSPLLNYKFAPRQAHGIFQNDRTVKVFRHFIYGPNTQTIGYSIGDSGAEITLMREDLRRQLGIEGIPTTVSLQWTDGSLKTVPAIRVTLELKSLADKSKILKLNNCFAVNNLNLPPRSLDVDKLKHQFPYLNRAEFESYENAMPVLLIGSPHAACFESIEPILENGEGKPVAIKSKLGWSIFGGEPENHPDMCMLEEEEENTGFHDKIGNLGEFNSSLLPRKHPFIKMLLNLYRSWSRTRRRQSRSHYSFKTRLNFNRRHFSSQKHDRQPKPKISQQNYGESSLKKIFRASCAAQSDKKSTPVSRKVPDIDAMIGSPVENSVDTSPSREKHDGKYKKEATRFATSPKMKDTFRNSQKLSSRPENVNDRS